MYFFGLGATKCGTTWLYEYLRTHPQCYLRGVKELHFFDSLDFRLIDKQIESLSLRIGSMELDILSAKPGERRVLTADLLDMYDFKRVLQTCRQDSHAYFKYMMAGLGNQQLVADITPNYAYLSTDMFRTMAGVADETRFLYLIRDPVSRFWSHLRMMAKRELPEGRDFNEYAREMLVAVLGDRDHAVVRTSEYRRTITNMREAIPADRQLVMFYEDLMTPAGLRRVCAFLNIRPIKADFERRVNLGSEAELTAAENTALRRFLQPEYDFVATEFSVLPKAWQESISLGFT